MKIGLVLDWYDPRRGGVEQWTHQFTVQLLSAGHDVHVVARGAAAKITPHGLTTHIVATGASRRAFAAAAEAALGRLSLDVVHDTGCGWRADVFQPHGGSRAAAFEQNLSLAPPWQRPWKRALAHWLPRYREFHALAARQYANDGRRILALSRMVSDDLRNYHNVAAERMRVIYNGVDVQRFSPARREEFRDAVRHRLGVRNEALLLIVAHNFRLKGVPELMAATAKLLRAGHSVRVAVVGGKRTGRYARRARSLGLGETITFLGAVDDVVPYYAAADVYVQPTYYDPCSLVALEALASGLPVVTTRMNGAGELMTSGREGYVLDAPQDVNALTAALNPLVASVSQRETMGREARQLALKHTLERNCREILSVYDEIAQSREPRRRRAA